MHQLDQLLMIAGVQALAEVTTVMPVVLLLIGVAVLLVLAAVTIVLDHNVDD